MTGPRPWPGAWMVPATTACTTRLLIGSMADQVLAAGRTGLAGALPGWHVNPFPVPDDTAAAEAAKTVFCPGRWPAGRRSTGATHRRAPRRARSTMPAILRGLANCAYGPRGSPSRSSRQGPRSLLRDRIVDERPQVF